MASVAIVGFGIEGQSALAYWHKLGHDVTVCDRYSDMPLPNGVSSQLGEDYLHDLKRFDIIVRSAGIAPDIILQQNPSVASKITTVINEFLRVCPTKNIIGITGTKGKGTTCTLTKLMLEAAGKHVFLGGNIGVSPFDFLAQLTPESWVVLELSSFQLIDLQYSPHIAVCLMVVPEHLNWHSDMQDYTTAKAQLFAHQTPNDIAIYFSESNESKHIASNSPGQKIPYFKAPGAYVDGDSIIIDGQHICKTSDLKLLGEHNWQNACAAVTATWQAIKAPDEMRSVLTTFTGLPHHLELVRSLGGIDYYDDSFGTTPETAIVAVQAFSKPEVIILGGSSKGISFDNLAKVVAKSNVRHVVVIGETAAEITQELQEQGFTATTPGGNSMQSIVDTARNIAQKGDIVLLSTACASFDLFKNYKDRGDQFKQVVANLS